MHEKVTIEPFRIKVVEQIYLASEEERFAFLKKPITTPSC